MKITTLSQTCLLTLSLLCMSQYICLAREHKLSMSNHGSLILAEDKEILEIRLMSPIDTRTNKQGDRVVAEIINPSIYRGWVLEGEIRESKSSNSFKGSAELLLAFDQMVSSSNQVRLVSSQVKSFTNSKGVEMVDEEGNVVKKSNNVGKVMLGAVLGGVAGAARGGGKGAAAGAAAGAIIAAVAVKLSVKGTHLTFGTGSQFIVEIRERRKRE